MASGGRSGTAAIDPPRVLEPGAVRLRRRHPDVIPWPWPRNARRSPLAAPPHPHPRTSSFIQLRGAIHLIRDDLCHFLFTITFRRRFNLLNVSGILDEILRKLWCLSTMLVANILTRLFVCNEPGRRYTNLTLRVYLIVSQVHR